MCVHVLHWPIKTIVELCQDVHGLELVVNKMHAPINQTRRIVWKHHNIVNGIQLPPLVPPSQDVTQSLPHLD